MGNNGFISDEQIKELFERQDRFRDNIRKRVESMERYVKLNDNVIDSYKQNPMFIYLGQTKIKETILFQESMIKECILYCDDGLLRSVLKDEYDDLKKREKSCVEEFSKHIDILKSMII